MTNSTDGLTVTKHNALIKAAYRLSVMELRIVLYGLSLINPMSASFPLSYKINIREFAEFFSLDPNWLYKDLKKIVISKFWEREFSYIDPEGKFTKSRWLIQVTYKDDEAYLEVFYNPLLTPMLQVIKSNFTSYHLSKVASMKSAYSIRLYEICLMEAKKFEHSQNNQSQQLTQFRIEIDKLRYLLQVGEKYKIFRDFKIRILEKAKAEINKHSDIKIKYEVIKKGRSPHFIILFVKKRQKASFINDYNELDNQLSFNFKKKKK